jgi:hypothetical protein
VAEEDSTEKEEEVLIETMRGWIVVGVEWMVTRLVVVLPMIRINEGEVWLVPLQIIEAPETITELWLMSQTWVDISGFFFVVGEDFRF